MKKHILIISQYFYPEQFRINDIAMEWVKRGYKVTVLTGIPNYPQGCFYKGYNWFKNRKEIWNGIEIIRIPLLPRGNSCIRLVFNYFSFVVSGFLWKCFSKIRADLVFTFELSPMTQALIGVWYAKKHKVPNWIYVQDLWPENVVAATNTHNKCIISSLSKMVKYIYKNNERIFATSPSFVRAITDRIPEEGSKVTYWPQYAEEFYKPSDEFSDLIPRDDVLNITFTGNIGFAQGLEILPKTAKILKEKGLFVRFNIVGEGRDKQNLLKCIREYDAEPYFNIIAGQPAEKVPAILAAGDAAFLSFSDNPLYSMTIPAKLQSYMACGCPIIGAVGGEAKRIIEESKCGLVSDLGDEKGLADVIVKFLSLSQSEKEEMGKRAVEYCNQHFNKKVLMDRIEDEINSLQ